jgi:hypothetical protein
MNKCQIKSGADWANPLCGCCELTLEQLYQAMKARLMDEVMATRPAGTIIYVNGVEVDGLPLFDPLLRLKK